jgi:hypothetical protein
MDLWHRDWTLRFPLVSLVQNVVKEVVLKIVKHVNWPAWSGNAAAKPVVGAMDPATATFSVPAIVASAFGKIDLTRRAGLLGRLLGSVGPLALAVIGGGVFAKFLPNAGWSVVPVSFEDAALATSGQVYELVRYVEQSNPNLIEGLMAALLQDGMVLAALGASIAAIAIKQASDRSGKVVTSPGKR